MKSKTLWAALLCLGTGVAVTAQAAGSEPAVPLVVKPAGVQATLRGCVVDSKTGEALVGATLQLEPGARTTFSADDGTFSFAQLGQRIYKLTAHYLGYRKATVSVNPARLDTVLVIRLDEIETSLGTATVTAQARRQTEQRIVTVQRQSLVVQNGVSAQQIARTQDKDASEVIRRVPGISIIDEKFVMVRGLSQRYNNVWMNGAAVPSTEADTRAFSFDIIPSSQLSDMQVIKSPSPQYPADFTGGFIMIETKDVPRQNEAHITLGTGVNDQTQFRNFRSTRGSGLDWLGFDNFRALQGGLHAPLQSTPQGKGVSIMGNSLDNDWLVRNGKPRPDLSMQADVTRCRDFASGAVLGVLAAVNYSNAFQTYAPMENSLFGAYDRTNDQSVYLRRATDRQYTYKVRLGGMASVTYLPAKGVGSYEWKHLFNRLASQRYTDREGFNAQSNKMREAEYYYSGRTTYQTQLTGKYVWDASRMDWSAGYAYANRDLPDRRRYTLDNQLDPKQVGLTTGNEITREFTRLDEHIASAGVNYRRDFRQGRVRPQLLAGAYGEYRTRTYNTRSFIYQWDPADNALPTGFRYMDLPTQLLQPQYYGDEGLYLIDDTKLRNDYRGHYWLGAAYASVNVPIGPFNVFAGLRYEHSRLQLVRNTRDYEYHWEKHNYDGDDLFPSVNMTYRFLSRHQLRASYGSSINRPEFREVSPSVFYDFDLASSVQGNANLKSCHIQNVDLRYEFYPSDGEQITLAAFFKHFDSPIEWVYTVSGGTDLIYSYENARRATSFGVELDIRKRLDFIGLKDFTLVANASLIKSRVKFDGSPLRKNRPMQGQSPYLVNVALFYQHKAWNASMQYNVIGKRLIGVGRNLGSTGDQTVSIPDAYEMPRHVLDISASHTLGRFTIKAGVKDVLAQRVNFKQFNNVVTADGQHKEVQEVTRSYRPGRNISLSLTYRL